MDMVGRWMDMVGARMDMVGSSVATVPNPRKPPPENAKKNKGKRGGIVWDA